MKVVVIGGHLSPALSVIEALPKEVSILFVGRKYSFEGDKSKSLEYETINSLKFPFAEITTARWQRKFTRHTINSLFKFPIGVIQSLFILLRFKPDVVVGFGGYVSLPVAISSFILRVPVVIHEQTLEAGFSNRIISVWASKICISWESSRSFFPKEKTVLTGNPIRKFEVPASQRGERSMKYEVDKKVPTIYITGGSSGSHFINKLVEGCIGELLRKFNIIHQIGESKFGDFERLVKLRETFSFDQRKRYILKKFVKPSQVASILKYCDLAISRSGINTITELIYFEKPAILIPLPFSQNNEQLKNARFLETFKLGKVLSQNEADSRSLSQMVDLIFDNIKEHKLNESESAKRQIENAAQNIVKIVEYVGETKKVPKL
ncbi:MAG: UDP-N-acetylglucosamine--N-acetylmuramyl-(pentapeptide) pyrophosphoryl-undecaprenol N-acetylglucosamine transferase [Candidatus Levybacteria bacterium]|nr:UDP-N-acetylglucosamine--N-acetylmuramyl-(pentapeptide) pyrophosphoryl-undecaprenol N-acetylglucosamine transferase [Candidatus Levybacteria bacterium]